MKNIQKYFLATVILLGTLMMFCGIAVYAQEAPISDVDTGMDSYQAIHWAVDNGFMKLTDGKFIPAASISRAEAAEMISLIRKDGDSLVTPGASTFKDVDSSNVNFKYIEGEKAYFMVGDGNFNPEGNLTREEASAAAVKLFWSVKDQMSDQNSSQGQSGDKNNDNGSSVQSDEDATTVDEDSDGTDLAQDNDGSTVDQGNYGEDAQAAVQDDFSDNDHESNSLELDNNTDQDYSIDYYVKDGESIAPELLKYVSYVLSIQLIPLRAEEDGMYFDGKKPITREDLAVLLYNSSLNSNGDDNAKNWLDKQTDSETTEAAISVANGYLKINFNGQPKNYQAKLYHESDNSAISSGYFFEYRIDKDKSTDAIDFMLPLSTAEGTKFDVTSDDAILATLGGFSAIYSDGKNNKYSFGYPEGDEGTIKHVDSSIKIAITHFDSEPGGYISGTLQGRIQVDQSTTYTLSEGEFRMDMTK